MRWAYKKCKNFNTDNVVFFFKKNKENYGSFFALLPTPLKTKKIRILKKCNKCLEISSFYTCVPQMTVIWCMVPEIWSATDRIFSHFGPLFHFLSFSFWAISYPFAASKIKILGISSSYTCVLKSHDQMMYGSWDMVRGGRTDRRMNGRTEKVTYRGGCST